MNIIYGSKIISDVILVDSNGVDHILKYILDTGSDITYISEDVYKKFGYTQYSTGTITTGNNSVSNIIISNVKLTLIGHTQLVNILVGVLPNKSGFDVIIGMDIISKCNLDIKTNGNGFTFNIEMPICK